ncbi:SusC/RagA family TonB-linked outer membrane protein [Fulvivirga maritima]|uniref:SusC/RagA family TonB-linked outer membrane protein n=1 Tax=Fulvivirga maritima TaxID=2904247 RepID=UPI001F203096|nr:SusC/RagA family TonB-linked outer membrane protein [Fulvivirga maritima]UII26167.1 SusC/RagA family TonB-linked outer membrane protein [Fulvivirga maritima]
MKQLLRSPSRVKVPREHSSEESVGGNGYYKYVKSLHLIRVFLLLIGVLFYSLSYSQTAISGKVTSADGEELPGVTVLVKGTSKGTITDVSGNFNIKVSSPENVLVFSIIGFKRQEIVVGNQSVINVALEEQVKNLDEVTVVAVGYQNMDRKKVTAAMTSVSSQQIENVPYSSVDQILSGKVAGLTSLSTSGEPGANTIVNIRGSNSVSLGGVSYPLYVIDGMIYNVNDMPSAYGNNPLTAINPNDIESIDVLKDASAAAIYGSRGANGVIIIKTKRGTISDKPQINVNFYAGVGVKPTLRNVITGSDERDLKLDMIYNNFGTMDHENFNMMLTDSLNGSFNNNRDWQDIFVQNSMLYNGDASISGSFKDNQYRVSLGYYNEEGVMIGYSLTRVSPRVYLSLNPKKRINFTVDIAPSFVDIKHGYGDGSNFPFSTWNFPSSLWYLTDEEVDTYRGQIGNLDDDKTTTIMSNAKLNIDLYEGLMFTSSFSQTYRNNRRDYLYSHLINGNDYDIAQNWDYETSRWEVENYFTYSRLIGDHNFSFILGQQASRQQNKRTYAYGNGVLANTIYSVSPGIGLYSETYSEQRGRLGFFGRANYDFKGKYLFSSSYRRDASSRYNEAKRWADFYSVSAGWIVSEEPFFMPLTNVINSFKIRASYGVTGNDPSYYYARYNLLGSNATYYTSSFGFNNGATATTYNGTTAISPNYENIASDRNVTWERYPQVNIGADLSLLNNRVNLQVDWYSRDSEDLFFNNMTAPVTSGYNYYSGNAVGLRNTGVEFTLNTTNLNPKGPLQWNTTLVLGINENYITELPNGGKDLTVGQPWMQYTLTVGQPLFQYRVWQMDGVYTSDEAVPTDPLTGDKMTYYGNTIRAGDPIYVDQNGDYNIDANDKIYGGDPNSEITGGLTNTFTYKNWSLSILCSFILGREVWNGYTSDRLNGSRSDTPWTAWGPYATLGIVGDIDYYRGPGDEEADYGSLTNVRLDRFHIANENFIENGSFFRIKNISLGYKLPDTFGNKIGLSGLRVYGMVDNVLLITDSTLPDPEAVGADGYSNGSTYPLAMKFTLGLTASF